MSPLRGRYKITPRCLLPIGDECKKDEKSAKNSEVKGGSRKKPKRRSRKLLEPSPHPNHESGPLDAPLRVSPMSSAARAAHEWAFEQAGVPVEETPWGVHGGGGATRGALIAARMQQAGVPLPQHVAEASSASRDLVPYTGSGGRVRRLETRAEKYADTSKCLATDFELIEETSKTLFEWSTIFMAGPVPVTIEVEVGILWEINLAVTVCIKDKTVIATLLPRVALEGSIFGGVTIPFFAKAGIQLTITLMDTTLLPSASLSFKSGMDLCLAMDLSLIPVALQIDAVLSFYICIKLCKVCIKIFGKRRCFKVPCGLTFCPDFEFKIWSWSMNAIEKNLFVICSAPPDSSPPDITNAKVEAVQTDPETIMVSWGGFRDKQSNVHGYSVCLGFTPGGNEVAECEDVELDKEYTFSFLNITNMDDVSVYATVMASNGEELESAASTRLVIDDSGPEVPLVEVFRLHDEVFSDDALILHSDTDSLTLRVTAVEPNPEPNVQVSMVEVAIGLGPDSYQDVAEWVETVADFADDEAAVVELTISGLQMQHEVEYYLHVRTTNTLGRQTITTAGTIVLVDTSPPEPVSVAVHNGQSIMLDWSLKFLDKEVVPTHSATSWTVSPLWEFMDEQGEIVECEAAVLDANGSPDIALVKRSVGPGVTTVTLDGLDMPHGFQYEVSVNCQNDAGLWTKAFSPIVAIDLTAPETLQVVDLTAPPPAESILSSVPEAGSPSAQGLIVQPLLSPLQVAALDVDFVPALTSLRAAFASWDPESGVLYVLLGAGLAPGSTSLVPWTRLALDGRRHVELQLPASITLERHRRYYVSVAAINVRIMCVCGFFLVCALLLTHGFAVVLCFSFSFRVLAWLRAGQALMVS